MNYLKHSLINTRDFLLGTRAYFKNVLLMHGAILFLLIPLLTSSTTFILRRGKLPYLSFDNIGEVLLRHPGVSFSLLLILIAVLLAIFFEFTFLLLSVYFIKKKQPVRLKPLLTMTLYQMKKVRLQTILFFFFYFFLVLPIGGFTFQSDLLSKVKIPVFIVDFIFDNRIVIIGLFLLFYASMIYLGIRLVFALPEMILRDRPFKQAIKESWMLTRKRFFAIVAQLLIITGSVLAVTTSAFFLILGAQRLVEEFAAEHALTSAIFAMTLLQFFLLINIVLSTVGIFYVIIDFMDDEGFLPELPSWFNDESKTNRYAGLIQALLLVAAIFFGVGVSLYNREYLTDFSLSQPSTISHRGVSNGNGVQNSISALERTSTSFSPDYIEMDIQLTSDGHFIVFHDFNFNALAGVRKKPEETTLAEAQALTVSENSQTEKISTFDDYLDAAEDLEQPLLIEIKTQKKDIQQLVELFLDNYQERLIANRHIVQSLSYQIIEEIKKQAPELTAGYILPFSLVGPPITQADFITIEYTTLTRNFIQTVQEDGKQVFVWTTNDEDTINRMIFYGADGIVTDQMELLNDTVNQPEAVTYSDKLVHFVLGVG